MSSLFDENKKKILSLGFAFHGQVPRKSADPERTIVDLLPSFFVDRKLFRMLLTWLTTTTEFIHLERLKSLSKNLAPNLKVVLGAVAKKQLKRDHRWQLIYGHIKSDLRGIKLNLQLPAELNDPYLLSKYGPDEEFAEFGVETHKILPEDKKKILTLKAILHSNAWLRLRAVMGANFRTDVAYLYVSSSAEGPAEAARILKCSRDTAYRNWRAMEEADARKILRIWAGSRHYSK